MAGSPITLTLYDANDEPIKNYSRSIIPWGILKSAIRISKEVDTDNMTEEAVDSIAGLVVEVFGNQFTVDELSQGADVSEMVTVMTAIMTKAKAVMPANPTKPAGK